MQHATTKDKVDVRFLNFHVNHEGIKPYGIRLLVYIQSLIPLGRDLLPIMR